MLINGFVPKQEIVDLSESKSKGEEDSEEHCPTPLSFP
jgi:hypothetical protein